jgi:tetratricopeptide (TPR) repeat protein
VHEREAVPPLFAELMREEEANAPLENVLLEASQEFGQDRFVSALGKFREALALSRGDAAQAHKVRAAAASEVTKLLPGNWRVAEAVLCEVEEAYGQSASFNTLCGEIERQKREDAIRAALEESCRAEQSGYLPHERARLLRLAQAYPGDAGLEARLHVVERLISQRVEDDRPKNFRRLALFRDRLDQTENPETLHGFRTLVAPFVDPYAGDPDFTTLLDDVSELRAAYANALALLSEQRSSESLEVCDRALANRPGNILFRRLVEKAKGREWVRLLTDSAVQRAREFEKNGQYAEAAEEWESLRAIDPHYPGLDSEVLHCEALREQAREVLAEEPEPVPEVLESDLVGESFPSFATLDRSSGLPLGLRIAITEEAWNHLKTGLVATAAFLLVVLMLAANARL